MNRGETISDEARAHPVAPRVVTGCEAVVRVEALAARYCAVGDPQQTSPGEQAWCRNVAQGGINAWGQPLRRLECGQASAVLPALTGAALSGLRVTGFLSAGSLAASIEELRLAVAQHVPMVVHVLGTAPGETLDASLRAVADSGAAIWVAREAQEAADLAMIARRLSEVALIPVLVVQDSFTAFQVWSQARLPDAAMVRDYLGSSGETIPSPTAAQRIALGANRARIPQRWSVDDPAWIASPSEPLPAALAQAGNSPFFDSPVADLADGAAKAFEDATGRDSGSPLGMYHLKGAKRVVVGQGAVVSSLEALADTRHGNRRTRFGVVNLRRYRPFPGPELAEVLKGREAVAVLERAAPALGGDAPLLREVRAALHRSLENGVVRRGRLPHPAFPVYGKGDLPSPLLSVCYGLGGMEADGADLAGVLAHEFAEDGGGTEGFAQPGLGVPGNDASFRESPRQEILRQELQDAFPGLEALGLRRDAEEALIPENALSLRIVGSQPALEGPGLSCLRDGSLEALLTEIGQCQVKGWHVAPRSALDRPAIRQVLAAKGVLHTQLLPRRVDAVVVLDPRVWAMSAPQAGLGDAPGPLSGMHEGSDLLLLGGAASLRYLPQDLRDALSDKGVRVFTLESEGDVSGPESGGGEANTTSGAAGWLSMGGLLALPAVGQKLGLDGTGMGRALKRWALVSEDLATEDLAANNGANGPGDRPDSKTQLTWLEVGTQTVRVVTPEAWPAPMGGGGWRRDATAIPEGLKQRPIHGVPAHDPHRFWIGTGALLARNREAGLRVDPAMSLGSAPHATGNLRDLTSMRLRHPRWVTGRCTGCGDCWVICPDGALPTQVNTAAELLQAGAALLEQAHAVSPNLPRALRAVEGKLKGFWPGGEGPATLVEGLRQAIAASLPALPGSEEEKSAVQHDLEQLAEVLDGLPLARTEPYFSQPESSAVGSGGWLSIALNPERCKACGLCLAVCPEEALVWQDQTGESLKILGDAGRIHGELAVTSPEFQKLSLGSNGASGGSEDGVGIRGLLLGRRTREAMGAGSDGAPGAAERTVLRLFAATVTGDLQPRIDTFTNELDELGNRMEEHIRHRLAVDTTDPEALREAMASLAPGEFTLGELSERLDRDRNPVDAVWLQRVTETLAGLRALAGRLRQRERAALGAAGAGGISSLGVWPFNPFPFPWSEGTARLGAAQALGLFEGHLARMAEDFRMVRLARLELEGAYNETEQAPFLARFGWRDFDDAEWALVPPVVLTADDTGLTGEALGMLAQVWRAGIPLRVLYLARQGAGSAGRSPAHPLEAHPEGEHPVNRVDVGALPTDPALLALAAGGVYIAQASLADVDDLVAGWRRGLASRTPALFSVFAAPLPKGAMPLEGQAVGTEGTAVLQARMAVGSRAHPCWRFDPALGRLPHEALDLTGNPQPEVSWGVQGQAGEEDGGPELTFAEYAVFHPGWDGHWHPIPDDEEEGWVPLAEFLELPEDEQAEVHPCALVATPHGVRRLSLSEALVRAAGEKAAAWRLLRSLARLDLVPIDEEAIAEDARREVTDKVWRNLMELAQSEGGFSASGLSALSGASGNGEGEGHA